MHDVGARGSADKLTHDLPAFQALDSTGHPLDAHFEIVKGDLVFHSRGGTKGKGAQNTDYSLALRLILRRLQEASISFGPIFVDSSRIQDLSESERIIMQPSESSIPADALFTLLSSRMKKIGRDLKAKDKGGNSTRRLRISVGGNVGDDELLFVLHGVASTQYEALSKEDAYSKLLALESKFGPSGPPPTKSRAASIRDPGLGFAYALELQGSKISPAIKVGFASDPEARLITLNRELRPHLTGCKWTPVLRQVFPTEMHAFRFEQLVINRLRERLVKGDREVVAIPLADLKKEWLSILTSKTWAE